MDKQEQLEELKKEILRKNLPLHESATNLVFGKGSKDAKILFIGEAPGKNEDEKGIPFVGRAGKVLDELLETINLTINDIYIANILKFQPPKNRDPNHEEILAHTPFLVKQIEIIKPTIIAPLGNYATKFILTGCKPEKMKEIAGITTLHGKSHKIAIGKKTYNVFPLFHPAALMYNRKLRPEAENDFKKLKEMIIQK